MSTHPAIRPDWLALVAEAAIEPDRPIVDAHHHLWDRPDASYRLADFAADLEGHNVVASVFAECRTNYRSKGPVDMAPAGETEFVLEETSAQAARIGTRVAAGIVAYADLSRGAAVADVLDEQLRIGGTRLRGIRNIAAWHPDARVKPSSIARPPARLLYDETFRAGFEALAERGLSFDTFVLHAQLGDVRDLARAFPQVRIIVDHSGGPLALGSRDTSAFLDWQHGMREAASCANVSVKIGGFGMPVFGSGLAQRTRPPTSDELAALIGAHVECCIDLFGTQRCMFESNFPVDKASCAYTVQWNAFEKATRHLPQSDRDRLFNGTAIDVYGLDLRADNGGSEPSPPDAHSDFN